MLHLWNHTIVKFDFSKISKLRFRSLIFGRNVSSPLQSNFVVISLFVFRFPVALSAPLCFLQLLWLTLFVYLHVKLTIVWLIGRSRRRGRRRRRRVGFSGAATTTSLEIFNCQIEMLLAWRTRNNRKLEIELFARLVHPNKMLANVCMKNSNDKVEWKLKVPTSHN